MSRTELSHFLDRAPHFFAYMTDNHKNHRPTLLGKILGVYRIVFKNDLTNVQSRSNLLVMENLFYGREVSHKFDLKGSIRNRLVNPCSEPRGEVVLLDENLLKSKFCLPSSLNSVSAVYFFAELSFLLLFWCSYSRQPAVCPPTRKICAHQGHQKRY